MLRNDYCLFLTQNWVSQIYRKTQPKTLLALNLEEKFKNYEEYIKVQTVFFKDGEDNNLKVQLSILKLFFFSIQFSELRPRDTVVEHFLKSTFITTAEL